MARYLRTYSSSMTYHSQVRLVLGFQELGLLVHRLLPLVRRHVSYGVLTQDELLQ